MSWGDLLEATRGLHCIGMSIPSALEQHARSSEDPSARLALRWRRERWRVGDPVIAMRSLASSARHPHDRFALETLLVCLERPSADHDRTLSVAVDQLRAERAGVSPLSFRRRATLRLALVVVALSGGESCAQATRRATAAFGRDGALLAALARAERGATPTVQAVKNLLSEERSRLRRLRRRLSWRALPRAVAAALMLTMALLGVVAPGSADLCLGGW